MALHLVKLAAGAENLDELKARVRRRAAAALAAGGPECAEHLTRMFPRRREELLDGGSLYWVVKGAVLVRQRILDLARRPCDDGIERCAIVLAPELIETAAQPRRAFQGWRYLRAEDAPADLKASQRGDAALQAELAELGLL
ncbi:MAG: DUF1489 domain-containing protein [Parvularculaceae bacterium]|nr:DUF1489 domain-containing protein [Parvularculaceae bacterium]